ncbi:MAG: hypothetical protein KR126chlam4_01066 [Candidatus Anoxychlamydiales bacterium]|nr:hypothetical protein [Candidatus Anoxychlamydiales bacterium]
MSVSSLLSYLNPFAYMGSKPLLEEFEVLSDPWWLVEGKLIRIIRNGEDLNYLVSHPITGENSKQGYINKKGLTAEETIERLKRKDSPQIEKNGDVTFTIGFKSQLDPHIQLDNNNWAITMVSWIRSSRCKKNPEIYACKCNRNPSAWAGHAVLLIEVVDNGIYIMIKTHLVQDKEKKKEKTGKVLSEIVTDFSKYRKDIKHQTETWSRSAKKVVEMIVEIEGEKAKQMAGEITVYLNLMGQCSPKKTASGNLVDGHNCYTWDRKMLSIAGVELQIEHTEKSPLEKGTGHSLHDIHHHGDFFTGFSPNSYINPEYIFSKAKVSIAIIGIKFFEKTPLDITNYIHKRTTPDSWQALSLLPTDTYNINGRNFDNVVAVAKASFDFLNDTISFHVEKLPILIKVRGQEHLCTVDIAEDVKDYMEKTLYRETHGHLWFVDQKLMIDNLLNNRPYDEGCVIV